MPSLSETEHKHVAAAAALQEEIAQIQQTLRARQATLRTTIKDGLRVRQETLGSWVVAAGLGEVEPAVLKPGLLALAAIIHNPSAFAQFCEEWLTPEERAGLQELPPTPTAEAAEGGRLCA